MAEIRNQDSVPSSSQLPTPNRFITTYNAAGAGIFDASIPSQLPAESSHDSSLALHLAYATTQSPADLTNHADLATYTSFLDGTTSPPGIFEANGTVVRIIDFAPGCETPMHRTVSLDYGVVLVGAVELVLDSGEGRVLRQSDVAVQRGTDHRWRNTSATEWARMMFVTLGAKPIEVNGKVLDFSYGMDR